VEQSPYRQANSGSASKEIPAFCGTGNEPSVSIKWNKFYLLKDFVSWSYFFFLGGEVFFIDLFIQYTFRYAVVWCVFACFEFCCRINRTQQSTNNNSNITEYHHAVTHSFKDLNTPLLACFIIFYPLLYHQQN
jgi:hypothetical protein